MPNGLPAFQPARGINADMLFAEKITDSDERFRRLENAVTDLRREFDAVMPAIVRLSAVEGDMQELLGQLQTLVNNGPADANMDLDAAPVQGVTTDSLPPRPFPEAPNEPPAAPQREAQPTQLAPPTMSKPVEPQPANALPIAPGTENKPAERAMPPPEFKGPAEQPRPPAEPPESGPKPAPAAEPVKPAAPPVAAPAPVPATGAGPVVKAIRIGQQDGGIVRIVLDLTGPSTHRSDLDNEEHLLLVEMPQASWSASSTGTFADSPLLKSWTTESLRDGKGTRLVLQLRTSVRIVSDSSLTAPDRIVLDLKASP